jgi:hypothetical protein
MAKIKENKKGEVVVRFMHDHGSVVLFLSLTTAIAYKRLIVPKR